MKVAVPKERLPEETRVAATPESVGKLSALGAEVSVQSGAGTRSGFSDADYEAVGGQIVGEVSQLLASADIVLVVNRPGPEVIAHLTAGSVLIGMLSPEGGRAGIEAIASRGVSAFAMELMPRISRAQSMDVLSSQSNLAGYRAVVDAAALFSRAIPMMMTAAGTIAPARVFVLGAGVAGLQAIATARRLGAVVTASDVRPAVKEQVESLGAGFVMVESAESDEAETAGGHAKSMSEDYRRRQQTLIADHLAKQDIVITTALIPGRPAPVLITQEMVERMRSGSIVIDLAVEQGGNCPLSRPGEVVQHGGVKVVGYLNMPGRLPVDASSMYARNLLSFLSANWDADSRRLTLDWDDELLTGTALTRDGQIVHPSLTQ